MDPLLAIALGVALILASFHQDKVRNGPASKALIWPGLWYIITASRSVSFWLYTLGLPVPGGSGDPTEGSEMERYFYGVLTLIGLWILRRRGFRWGDALRLNPWATALMI